MTPSATSPRKTTEPLYSESTRFYLDGKLPQICMVDEPFLHGALLAVADAVFTVGKRYRGASNPPPCSGISGASISP